MGAMHLEYEHFGAIVVSVEAVGQHAEAGLITEHASEAMTVAHQCAHTQQRRVEEPLQTCNSSM